VALYFAYGSNLVIARMRQRVPSARALGRARLDGRRLALDKRGRDGSAKANLRPDPAAHVWGALYRLDPRHWPALDACEPGYARVAVEVRAGAGERVAAETYVAQVHTDEPAWDWYLGLLLQGARDHGLPEEYRTWLASLPARKGDAGNAGSE
jgi:gamma-glutamylcyclotransferase (GGCT)/AIG2-like uncharacterized protein YtfP